MSRSQRNEIQASDCPRAHRRSASCRTCSTSYAASAYAHSDDQATYQNLAQQLGSSVETAAGMGGGENLDFEAVERSSKAVEDFLAFVATRLQTTTSYSETTAEGVRSHSESQVTWQE